MNINIVTIQYSEDAIVSVQVGFASHDEDRSYSFNGSVTLSGDEYERNKETGELKELVKQKIMSKLS